MNVGIYDACNQIREKSNQMIESYAKENGLSVRIQMFVSEDELCAYIGKPIDIFFIGISKSEPNSLKVAWDVSKKWGDSAIVFMAKDFSMAMDAYRVKHSYYVLHNALRNKISEIVDIIQQNQEGTKKFVFEQVKGGITSVNCSDVYCIEHIGTNNYIFTKWGTFRTRQRLNDIEKHLEGTQIVRCHNSYMINLNQAYKIQQHMIYLENEMMIPVSRNYYNKIKNMFKKDMLYNSSRTVK